jgi:hypothetical protein
MLENNWVKLDCTVMKSVNILVMMVSTVVRTDCMLGWMESKMELMGCTLDSKDYHLE